MRSKSNIKLLKIQNSIILMLEETAYIIHADWFVCSKMLFFLNVQTASLNSLEIYYAHSVGSVSMDNKNMTYVTLCFCSGLQGDKEILCG